MHRDRPSLDPLQPREPSRATDALPDIVRYGRDSGSCGSDASLLPSFTGDVSYNHLSSLAAASKICIPRIIRAPFGQTVLARRDQQWILRSMKSYAAGGARVVGDGRGGTVWCRHRAYEIAAA